MSDLVEFLCARLDEDEAAAGAARDGRSGFGDPDGVPGVWYTRGEQVRGLELVIYDEGGHTPEQAEHVARWDPARVLAEVAAKRARLTFLAETAARCPEDDWPAEGGMEQAPMADMARYLLRMEAQSYSDHPDFDPKWRLA